VLSDDWGFYYDAKSNLDKVKTFASTFKDEGKLDENSLRTVSERVEALIKAIENTPKTRNFQNRAKKGTSIPWYNDVEEVER